MSSWNAVVKDMLDRNEFGASKYNKYLDENTNENMLQHAYEEALDLAVYLKTRMLQEERNNSIAQQLKRSFEKFKYYDDDNREV
ncbi:MAG: hypothetical protein QX189_02795 [Methylococcales bacterium]